MKTLRLLLLGFLFAFGTAGLMPATARADDAPSFDYFYDALQDYGQWLQVDGLGNGYVWQPTEAQDPNWQPYTDGYWAYTDAGWTWVSYEEFGWITYHYGRWTRLEDIGWVWVPDYEWAPAWVSWRQTRSDYGPDEDANLIGWAPLPPEVRFRHGIGITFSVDADYDIGPGYYSFCRVHDFGSPVLAPVIIDRSRNVTIINNTTNITNITTNNNIIYNGGPSYTTLSRHVDAAHPIQALQLVRQTDGSAFRHGGKGSLAQAKGNQLVVAAPVIVAPTQQFTPQKVARTIDKPKIDKGWSKVTDPNQKLQLQNSIHAQTKGIKPNQPAAAVTAQQLAVIPKGSTPIPKGGVTIPKGTFQGTAATPAPAGTPAPNLTGQSTPPPTTGMPTPTPGGKKGRKGQGTPFVPVQPPTNPTGQPTPAPAAGLPTPAPGTAPTATPRGPKGRTKPLATPFVPVQPPTNAIVQPTAPPATAPTATPQGSKGRPKFQATPFVPAAQQPVNIVKPTPPPATPPLRTPPPRTPPPATPPPATPRPKPTPNAALIQQQQQQQAAAAAAAKQRQLEQQQAAGAARQQQAAAAAAQQQQAAAAAAARQQQAAAAAAQQRQAAAAAAARQPQPPPQPRPPGPVLPPRGGKPTPTPTPEIPR